MVYTNYHLFTSSSYHLIIYIFNTNHINMFIPRATYLWLLICTAGIIYDTLYIQLRPLTFRYNIYEWKF